MAQGDNLNLYNAPMKTVVLMTPRAKKAFVEWVLTLPGAPASSTERKAFAIVYYKAVMQRLNTTTDLKQISMVFNDRVKPIEHFTAVNRTAGLLFIVEFTPWWKFWRARERIITINGFQSPLTPTL